MKFGTKAVHAGVHPDPTTGAIMTPIFQTSTYAQVSPGAHKGYEYSRTQNPTRFALRDSIAALEDGKTGLIFSSGMGAIDTLMKILKPGDEVISSDDLYGGSYRLFSRVYEGLGIKFHFTDMRKVDNVKKLVNEKTKLIWVETPTNPMMNIVDIQAIADLKKGTDILLAVDNTFATPYLQLPLALGADVVMHSVTKYLGGHSDVVMGALVLNDLELAEKLAFLQNSAGAVPGPQDCFLVLRGIKTLHLRMKQHCENARALVPVLQDHPLVEKVYWPGLKDHANYEVAARQMKDFGGMISFVVKGSKEAAFKVMEKFELFTIAESLGGVESLVNHPATMTHASVPPDKRLELGIVDNLVRLSVGVEEPEDLVSDLKQALEL